MAENWLSDEIRSRNLMFWGRRGSWPIEAQGFLLLANAMLRVGSALYGEEWQGDEPFRAWMPVLSRKYPRPLSTQGFDAVYAEGLLANCNPSALERPYDGNRDFFNEPLTASEWAAAFDAYEQYEQHINALAATKVRQISRVMVEAFANAVLISAIRRNGQFDTVPASHWNDEGAAYARFIESQMNPSTPFEQNWPTLYEAIFWVNPPPMLVPGNEWIFVEANSLDSFLQGLPVRPTGGKIDRSPKVRISAKQAAAWVHEYFGKFVDPDAPRYRDAKAAFRESVPNASTVQFDKEIWPKRPAWMPRKAPKGA